jgi:molybdopterin-synthase adenylyltransferase
LAAEAPPPRVVVCGVGAVGSLAVVAARNIAATFVFVDFDRVESKNLLAQAYVKQSLGKLKAEALKLQLLNFYGLKSEAMPVKVSDQNVAQVCAGATLVVDCFDNAASRSVLSSHCQSHQLALVHAAISGDGTFGLVRWNERFTPDAEDHPGQPTCEGGAHLPLLSVLSGSLARVLQDFLEKGVRRDVMVSLTQVQPTS